MNVNQTLATRLRGDFIRKGLDVVTLAERIGLDGQVIAGYLQGTRTLDFSELEPICRAIGTDLLWLLSPNYKPSRLIYRDINQKARARAGAVERAFAWIANVLPAAITPEITPIPATDREARIILLALEQAIAPLRSASQTVEALYRAHQLPVIWPGDMDGLDGFILGAGKRFLVCVNAEVPNQRLEFTLLHEFAHFAFDRTRDVPLDAGLIMPSAFYQDEVSEEARTEFIANKFAQLYLVPLGTANAWVAAVEPEQTAAAYAQQRGISPHVAANALFDAFRLNGKPRTYAPLRDAVTAAMARSGGRPEVAEFVANSSEELRQRIAQIKDDFGERRWCAIKEAFGIDG